MPAGSSADWLRQEQVEAIVGHGLSKQIEMVLTAADRLFFKVGDDAWIEAL